MLPMSAAKVGIATNSIMRRRWRSNRARSPDFVGASDTSVAVFAAGAETIFNAFSLITSTIYNLLLRCIAADSGAQIVFDQRKFAEQALIRFRIEALEHSRPHGLHETLEALEQRTRGGREVQPVRAPVVRIVARREP